MDLQLNDRTVLVTGGSSGVGLATVAPARRGRQRRHLRARRATGSRRRSPGRRRRPAPTGVCDVRDPAAVAAGRRRCTAAVRRPRRSGQQRRPVPHEAARRGHPRRLARRTRPEVRRRAQHRRRRAAALRRLRRRRDRQHQRGARQAARAAAGHHHRRPGRAAQPEQVDVARARRRRHPGQLGIASAWSTPASGGAATESGTARPSRNGRRRSPPTAASPSAGSAAPTRWPRSSPCCPPARPTSPAPASTSAAASPATSLRRTDQCVTTTAATCWSQVLREAGVDTVFGIVSVHNLPLVEAVERAPAVRAGPPRGDRGQRRRRLRPRPRRPRLRPHQHRHRRRQRGRLADRVAQRRHVGAARDRQVEAGTSARARLHPRDQGPARHADGGVEARAHRHRHRQRREGAARGRPCRARPRRAARSASNGRSTCSTPHSRHRRGRTGPDRRRTPDVGDWPPPSPCWPRRAGPGVWAGGGAARAGAELTELLEQRRGPAHQQLRPRRRARGPPAVRRQLRHHPRRAGPARRGRPAARWAPTSGPTRPPTTASASRRARPGRPRPGRARPGLPGEGRRARRRRAFLAGRCRAARAVEAGWPIVRARPAPRSRRAHAPDSATTRRSATPCVPRCPGRR